MINFLEFINKDITAKKTLITSMPVKTKTNIKKYNSALDEMKKKYTDYKGSVYNYLLAKSRSFNLKNEKDNVDKVTDKVVNLERVKFVLNPTNTYFEKMSFDVLLYQLNNSYMFNFKSLNDVINGFLDKFELVGVKLTSNDFDYTCYVHEYMTSFLEVRYSDNKKYAKVSAIFEQIYWMNPELIDHIELNFRKLIRKHEKKFMAYISKMQKQSMIENGIKNYQDCLEKLKSIYVEYNISLKEDVYDIVLDPGHGGNDPGAVKGKAHEADYNLKYKKNISGNVKLIEDELKRCADELASTDISMQTIRNMIFEEGSE